MELVINRKRWGRGEGQGLLLDAQTDKMCCLGFAGRACGVPKKELSDKQMPSDVEKDLVKRNQEFWRKLTKNSVFDGVVDTKLSSRLALINDDDDITDTVREKLITAKFKKIGVSVTFKG